MSLWQQLQGAQGTNKWAGGRSAVLEGHAVAACSGGSHLVVYFRIAAVHGSVNEC